MKDNQFDKIIKNSLIDEKNITPEESLIINTKNLIQGKRNQALWLNKIYVFCLAFVCLLFSLKAIHLAIQSKNIIILISLIISHIAVIILNFIYQSEIKTFFTIKEGQI